MTSKAVLNTKYWKTCTSMRRRNISVTTKKYNFASISVNLAQFLKHPLYLKMHVRLCLGHIYFKNKRRSFFSDLSFDKCKCFLLSLKNAKKDIFENNLLEQQSHTIVTKKRP